MLTPEPRTNARPPAPPEPRQEIKPPSAPPVPSEAPAPRARPAPSPTTAPAVVRMTADPPAPAVGTTIVLRVEIIGGVDVGSVPFHVLYNSSVLEFDHGEEGTFLGGDGRQTAFFATPTTSRDRIVVGLSRLGGEPGIAGDGMLCSLYFRALAPGPAGIAFASQKVRDGDNRIVPSTFLAPAVAPK